MPDISNLEMRSRIGADGRLRLSLEPTMVGEPAADELIVRIDAAPLNPSDVLLLLGPVDRDSLRASGSGPDAVVEGTVPDAALPGIAGRLDQSLPVGNEGAGTVVAAGRDADQLVGRVVALRASAGSYSTYQRVKASDCLILPEGFNARDGAAAFINPLTALGMTETMRREGHRALVHTAAASNLGQMLNRLCIADDIPLVNIVRSAAQVAILQDQGARHVLDSTDPADTSDEGMVPADKMEEIQRLLDRKRPAVSRCIGAAIDAKELPKSARGKVNLAIVIGTSGRAESVKVISSNLESKSLQDCVVAKVQEIPFPTLPKSYETSYAYGFEAM
jgi:NADPH:quinone reductase-like Zn-dependent oxidoreductase